MWTEAELPDDHFASVYGEDALAARTRAMLACLSANQVKSIARLDALGAAQGGTIAKLDALIATIEASNHLPDPRLPRSP